ncbi:MAG: GntR family transcriptional regulator [Sebaldella sp.]|nr:GntR family transcriptional regulator [Sebaldella sp.]
MLLEIKHTGIKETIRSQVYNILKENIISAGLEPGSQVSEQELGDELKVSRTPVREALIHLAQEELVEIIPQKGTYISKINIEAVEESRYMRQILEVDITKEAAREFPETLFFSFEENLSFQKLYLEQRNYTKLFEYDEEFHKLIYIGTNKMRIWKSIQNISGQLNRVRVLSLSDNSYELWSLIYNEHLEIFNMIKNHKVNEVQDVVIRHLERGKIHVQNLMEKYKEYF